MMIWVIGYIVVGVLTFLMSLYACKQSEGFVSVGNFLWCICIGLCPIIWFGAFACMIYEEIDFRNLWNKKLF